MILFTASWCGICPAVKKWVAEDYNGVLAVTTIDIDNDPDSLAQKHKIKSLPTLVVNDELKVYGEYCIKEYLNTVQRDV